MPLLFPVVSILFHSALLYDMTDNEVRYVIAHDIRRVVLALSKKAFQISYAVSSSRQAFATSDNSAPAALIFSKLGHLGKNLINALFSPHHEKEP